MLIMTYDCQKCDHSKYIYKLLNYLNFEIITNFKLNKPQFLVFYKISHNIANKILHICESEFSDKKSLKMSDRMNV